VTDGLDVVAVWIEDIAAVVVGVVPRTKTWRTVIASACGECCRVERIDGGSVWRRKRNVHRRCGLAFRDEEVNASWRAEADPAFHLSHLDPERSEHRLVEARTHSHVPDGDGEMVDEGQVLDFTNALDLCLVTSPGRPGCEVSGRP
jgi:hypothetical protein